MYYKELLKVRRCFLIFAGIIGVLAVVGSAIPNASFHIPAGANPQIPIIAFLIGAGVFSAIFATILGTSLSSENDGHLQVVWALPTSRIGYAARILAVDASAIVALFALVVLAAVAVIYAHGFGRYLMFERDSLAQLLRFLLYPLAWFGLVQALTASVRNCHGAYAGWSWPAAFILILLYEAHLPPFWHIALKVVNLFNPMVYASYASGSDVPAELLTLNAAVAAGALGVLSILGIALALVQWRRLQA